MGEHDDDVLSGEVSVAARIDETGLSAKAKSRAVNALDRLFGSLIDVPGAWLEGHSRQIRLKNRTREALLAADGEAAVRKLEEYEELGQRTAISFLREVERKQTNRDEVGLNAIEQLKALPPPEDSPESDGPSEIGDDWMNVFSSHVENASSEHLRQLWARILAGEIRQPGSFSLTTLRAISELDRDIAEMFQSKMVNRMEGGFLPKPENLRGRELLDLTFLEEVGLLQEVNGLLGRDLEPSPDGYAYVSHRNMALRIKPAGSLRIPLIRVTRVGREISSILPPEPADRALRVLAETLKKKASSIDLCVMLPSNADGKAQLAVLETLHSKGTAEGAP